MLIEPHARGKRNLLFYKETANFVDITTMWSKIVNVKKQRPHKGKRLKDIFQEPRFPSMDDTKVAFLHQLLDWLDTLRSKDLAGGTLTNPPSSSPNNVCAAIINRQLLLRRAGPGQPAL